MQTKANKDFRVILLTHGGADEVLRQLAELENVRLVGVFIETDITPRRSLSEKLKRSLRYDGLWATVGKFLRLSAEAEAEGVSEDLTEKVAREAGIEVQFVRNYHDADAISAMQAANADLAVIYGTNIIKEAVFSIPRMGAINLHQGLAPLYRGSAPVFWELYNGEAAVGVTVHRVAAKVDTGDVALQKTVPLVYDFDRYNLDFDKFINDFRGGLKSLCAEMVAETVLQIMSGEVEWTQQDTSVGHRYKLPTKREKDELRRRLKSRRQATVNNTQTALREAE
jgi:methionyl-tRNA formyltransferase